MAENPTIKKPNKRRFFNKGNKVKKTQGGVNRNTKESIMSKNLEKPSEASIEQLKNRIDVLDTNEKFYAVSNVISMIERGYIGQIKAMNYMLEKHGKDTRVTEDISLQRYSKDFIEPSININHALVVLSSAVFSGAIPLEELSNIQTLSKENQKNLKEFERILIDIFARHSQMSLQELPYNMKKDILTQREKLKKQKQAAEKVATPVKEEETTLAVELPLKDTKTKDEWLEFAKEHGINVPDATKLKDDIYEFIKKEVEIKQAS